MNLIIDNQPCIESFFSSSDLGKVALPPLSGSAFLLGADLGVNSPVETLGVEECLGALPVETTWRGKLAPWLSCCSFHLLSGHDAEW